MANLRIRTEVGQEFILDNDNDVLRELGASCYGMNRSALRAAFKKINNLLTGKEGLYVTNLASNTSIGVRNVVGFYKSGGRKVRTSWGVRRFGNDTISIGCKIFLGRNANALWNWALESKKRKK